jgi:hypothetical protein
VKVKPKASDRRIEGRRIDAEEASQRELDKQAAKRAPTTAPETKVTPAPETKS